MNKIGILGFSTNVNTKKIETCSFFRLLNLTVTLGEHEYVRGDISLQNFYTEIEETNTMPQSSQPSTGIIVDELTEMLKHYKEIIVIAPRKELSGTYQNVILSKEILGEDGNRVHLVSSMSVATNDSICTEIAIDMVNEGKEVKEITKFIDEKAINLQTYALPDSMNFLKLSGRVSGVGAVIGGMFHIKVVVKCDKEAVKLGHKGRGIKSTIKYLISEIEAYKPQKIYMCKLGVDEETYQLLIEKLSPYAELVIWDEGDIVVGTHFGPGSSGITLYK